jgi:Cellulase (glycosyl hydrolase family 5)
VQVAAIARAAAAAVTETRADAEREAAGVQAAARAELARAENLRADAKREAAEQLDAAQAELALAKMVRGDADADHSPKFWSSVATYFKANPAVVFDLYNEPHVGSWACWRDGCTSSAGWRTAGMQALVNARPVRRDAGDVLGHQPSGSTLSSVQPYVADLSWNDIFSAPVRLTAGWNQVSWTVPTVNGINAIGIQLNDDSAWHGQILLDSVNW